MTTDLWCAPHIHLAAVNEDVILLDLDGDRYDCLLDAARWLFPGDQGRIQALNPEAADALVSAGIATPVPLSAPRRPLLRPRREVAPSSHPPRGEVLRAFFTQASATMLFQRKSLLELVRLAPSGAIQAARPLARLKKSAAPPDVAVLTSAARLARPWIPFEGECLQRSFQLGRYLAFRGVATDWVFGVRTWPFSAHCWLQAGDLVVGDRLERVRRYTPILAV